MAKGDRPSGVDYYMRSRSDKQLAASYRTTKARLDDPSNARSKRYAADLKLNNRAGAEILRRQVVKSPNSSLYVKNYDGYKVSFDRSGGQKRLGLGELESTDTTYYVENNVVTTRVYNGNAISGTERGSRRVERTFDDPVGAFQYVERQVNRRRKKKA